MIKAPDLNDLSKGNLYVVAFGIFLVAALLIALSGLFTGAVWWFVAAHTHSFWWFFLAGIGWQAARVVRAALTPNKARGGQQ
jgi:hypothetical protein